MKLNNSIFLVWFGFSGAQFFSDKEIVQKKYEEEKTWFFLIRRLFPYFRQNLYVWFCEIPLPSFLMNTKVFLGVSPKGMLSSIIYHKLFQNPDGMHLLHKAVKQTDSLLLLPRVWIGKINILCNCLDHLCLPLMCLSDPKAIFGIRKAANTAC